MRPTRLGLFPELALCLAAGCSTEVAQTATLGPTDPLSCAAPGAVELPTGGAFGDGTEPASPLVGSGYVAGHGPGLHVVARDAFRVYLNGELVVESEDARQGVFVPLTLLPGDNALSVVVSAAGGTPAALVELEELDQDMTSDVSWKVSVDPESGYASPGFDDSSWPAASDLGSVEALPGCHASGSFPPSSGARWIGPEPGTGRTAVLRKVVRIAPIGYGRATTGGSGATPTLVSTWDELVAAAGEPDTPGVILLAEGVHDFRDEREQLACPSVCTNDMTKPHYDLLTSSETCSEALVAKTRSDRTLVIGSNKTIVGLGRGALVRGVTFLLSAVENTIVRNVALYDVNPELGEAGDAFTLDGSRRIWIDHVTTKWISDGFSDVLPGGDAITFSWVHYDGVAPGACRGFHTQAVNVGDSIVTLHHCFFDHVESHAPRVEGPLARVHVFGNLFADNASYAVASICNSDVLMEANALERVREPTNRGTCDDDTGPGKINAPEGSNDYVEDVGEHHGGDGMEPHDRVFTPPYDYPREAPDGDRVRSRAGAGGPWARSLSLD